MTNKSNFDKNQIRKKIIKNLENNQILIKESDFNQKKMILARKQMEEDAEKRKHQIDVLRDKSRREYLKKREGDQIDALEADLVDEEYLFDNEELTVREKDEFKRRKELLAIAKQYNKDTDI